MSRLIGVENLLANLARVGQTAPAAALAGVQVAAEDLMEEARGLAPIQSGELAEGLEINDVQIDGHDAAASIDSTAPHSIHVEYGTQRADAQPFLRPAADRQGPAAGQLGATAMRRHIEQQIRK